MKNVIIAIVLMFILFNVAQAGRFYFKDFTADCYSESGEAVHLEVTTPFFSKPLFSKADPLLVINGKYKAFYMNIDAMPPRLALGFIGTGEYFTSFGNKGYTYVIDTKEEDGYFLVKQYSKTGVATNFRCKLDEYTSIEPEPEPEYEGKY